MHWWSSKAGPELSFDGGKDGLARHLDQSKFGLQVSFEGGKDGLERQ